MNGDRREGRERKVASTATENMSMPARDERANQQFPSMYRTGSVLEFVW